MSRAYILVAVLILLISCTACKQTVAPAPLVLRVLRNRSGDLGDVLSQTDVRFSLTLPSVHNSRPVKIETVDAFAFMNLEGRLRASTPAVLIFDSVTQVPDDPSVRNQLGGSQSVCGQHPAFLPTSISGDEREAAEMYVRFLVSHCPTVAPRTAASDTNRVAEAQQPEDDPHRPACATTRCQKIKKFLRGHYCGESPFGNGPDDGCDIRARKNTTSGTKVTADYVCSWNEKEGKPQCRTEGTPTPEERLVLLREMHRVGLPNDVAAEKEVRFRILASTSGWFLMAADYDHIEGPDLTLCRVVILTDHGGQVRVLRKVPLQKTNADVPEVTTWWPVDIADVDDDGNLEIVLEGDAYEDHWFEVVSVQGDSFETIFSGLGYYL